MSLLLNSSASFASSGSEPGKAGDEPARPQANPFPAPTPHYKSRAAILTHQPGDCKKQRVILPAGKHEAGRWPFGEDVQDLGDGQCSRCQVGRRPGGPFFGLGVTRVCRRIVWQVGCDLALDAWALWLQLLAPRRKLGVRDRETTSTSSSLSFSSNNQPLLVEKARKRTKIYYFCHQVHFHGMLSLSHGKKWAAMEHFIQMKRQKICFSGSLWQSLSKMSSWNYKYQICKNNLTYFWSKSRI